MLRNFIGVTLGGALGSATRYGVALLAQMALGNTLWGTLFVNVLGSGLLGAILASGEFGTSKMSPEFRLWLGTGVMGGFTTYSTFNAETLRLIQSGSIGRAFAYVGLTLVLSGLAGWAGWMLAKT